MFYPLRIYEGRDAFFIAMTYAVDIKSKTRCQGWGVVNSNVIYSLGDRFMSTRNKSDILCCEDQEYYFIDFACEDKKAYNPSKILKSSLDVRQESIDKQIIPLVITDNEKEDLIIGLGKIDFLKRKVELDMLEGISLRILSFFA